ncbi:MAG: hypothetical protein HUU28_00750 [Planctomycetaceae bacterium]|nr:hypothetical protein [Planctomycetaceae bacterium]
MRKLPLSLRWMLALVGVLGGVVGVRWSMNSGELDTRRLQELESAVALESSTEASANSEGGAGREAVAPMSDEAATEAGACWLHVLDEVSGEALPTVQIRGLSRPTGANATDPLRALALDVRKDDSYLFRAPLDLATVAQGRMNLTLQVAAPGHGWATALVALEGGSVTVRLRRAGSARMRLARSDLFESPPNLSVARCALPLVGEPGPVARDVATFLLSSTEVLVENLDPGCHVATASTFLALEGDAEVARAQFEVLAGECSEVLLEPQSDLLAGFGRVEGRVRWRGEDGNWFDAVSLRNLETGLESGWNGDRLDDDPGLEGRKLESRRLPAGRYRVIVGEPAMWCEEFELQAGEGVELDLLAPRRRPTTLAFVNTHGTQPARLPGFEWRPVGTCSDESELEFRWAGVDVSGRATLLAPNGIEFRLPRATGWRLDQPAPTGRLAHGEHCIEIQCLPTVRFQLQCADPEERLPPTLTVRWDGSVGVVTRVLGGHASVVVDRAGALTFEFGEFEGFRPVGPLGVDVRDGDVTTVTLELVSSR